MTFVRIWQVKIVFVHIVVRPRAGHVDGDKAISLLTFCTTGAVLKYDFLLLRQHGNSQGPKKVSS